ncbi:zinc finger, CCHC-type containing protein [Tanacetum coccineum]
MVVAAMSVVYVFTTSIPEDGENATVNQIRRRNKWDNDDYICRDLILKGMSDPLFNIYQNIKFKKELWDSLEAKYMANDASSKKFLVSNFTNYKMTYSRPIMEQYNELLGILERFTQHKMNTDEAIQVSCIIDKLPPLWKDFKHTLKHLKEELTLIELGSHLRIEESLRAQDSDKPKSNNVVGPQLNIVNDNIASTFMSISKLNDSIIWHARLGHVLFKRMQDMSKDGLIPAFDIDTGKYEALDKFKVFKTEVELQQRSLIKRFRTDREGEYMDTLYFQAVVRLPGPKLKKIVKEALNASLLDMLSIPRLLVLRPSLSIPKGTEDIGGSIVPEKVTKEDDPKTFDEAMKSLDIAFWKETINDEMNYIMGNNAWLLDDLPLSCKPFDCKWIFKRKLKVDGTIKNFKARLVIRGFRQKSGIDYFDTYAPVTRISTIRLLIAMTLIHNLIIHQMDVKTAFLNAPKQWHQKFDKVVFSNGYLLNQADKCVYNKFDESGKRVIICQYVDDMLIFGTDQVQVDLTKEFLSSRFSMKDMGEADVILGVRIKHESNGITISQSHYIENVMKKFNYFYCTPVSTPMDISEKLMPNNSQAVSQLEYSRVIGCLMYVMTCTQPDIAFAVGKLSRLTYTSYPSVLKSYTDASWISNTKDNSSTSGWVFLLDGGIICWGSKKQTCITGSTMESEFVALSATGKEAKWLRNLIFEISLCFKHVAPISICCDSVATLANAYSQMYNGKSRHLGVRHIMIRELITNGSAIYRVCEVSTKLS